MNMTVIVVTTIDYPSDWGVSFVASSRDKAEEILRRENPQCKEWRRDEDGDVWGDSDHGWSFTEYRIDAPGDVDYEKRKVFTAGGLCPGT